MENHSRHVLHHNDSLMQTTSFGVAFHDRNEFQMVEVIWAEVVSLLSFWCAQQGSREVYSFQSNI